MVHDILLAGNILFHFWMLCLKFLGWVIQLSDDIHVHVDSFEWSEWHINFIMYIYFPFDFAWTCYDYDYE